MKQNKGKYIRLTESQLTSLIQEEVQKQLQILKEYAEPRNKFVDRCANQFNQIFENWCLCRYCTLINTDINMCHNHWRTELLTAINNIAQATIKGHDNAETRQKAIIEGFDRSDAFGSHDLFNKKMLVKFYKENFKPNKEVLEQCFTDFDKDINMIIELISKNEIESIIDYIEKL